MVEQASLESKFDEQDYSNTEKFVMTEPLKRCKKCGELKPNSDFYKRNRHLISICKECNNKRTKKWYDENTDHHKQYEKKYYEDHKRDFLDYGFLYGKNKNTKRVSGYFYGTGVCLICGEIQPLFIENHHVSPDCDNVVVSLCSNHHRMYKTKKRDTHMIAVLNAIENSKFLWDEDGNPKGTKKLPMWTSDLPLKEAIEILKSYDLPGYEPIGIEV